jgi:hypothetical protein
MIAATLRCIPHINLLIVYWDGTAQLHYPSLPPPHLMEGVNVNIYPNRIKLVTSFAHL